MNGKNLNNFLLLQHINPFFIFDGEYYTQSDVAAMEFPLGLKLANAFCVILRKNEFQNARQNFYRMFTKGMLMKFL